MLRVRGLRPFPSEARRPCALRRRLTLLLTEEIYWLPPLPPTPGSRLRGQRSRCPNPRWGRSILASGARILVRVAQFWPGGARRGRVPKGPMSPAVGPTKKPESSLGSFNFGLGARSLVRVAQKWHRGPESTLGSLNSDLGGLRGPGVLRDLLGQLRGRQWALLRNQNPRYPR